MNITLPHIKGITDKIIRILVLRRNNKFGIYYQYENWKNIANFKRYAVGSAQEFPKFYVRAALVISGKWAWQ